MIETLSTDTPQKPFTDGIRARGEIRSCENLDATRLRNPSEAHPKFAVVITDEVLRPHTIGGGFPQLLCGPGIGRRSCDTHMGDPAGVEFADEEGIQRPEKQVCDRGKGAGPDLLRMVV